MPVFYYYCLIDILRQTERKMDNVEKALNQLATVGTNSIACNGFRIDTFVVDNRNTILDANTEEGVQQFAQLLTQTKLFHINVELAFDEILTERHTNPGIRRSLENVFGTKELPDTVGKTSADMSDETVGKLRHPMLAHMEVSRLAALYCKTIRELDKNKIEHNMLQNVIGHKSDLFTEQHEGFVCGHFGLVKIAHLLRNGFRMDHEPNKGQENYISDGEREAKPLENSDAFELLLAWMECDGYEMRRCFELDMFMNMKLFKNTPKWVELETFSFLKQEAKKQEIAKMFFKRQSGMNLQSKAPTLYDAMRQNANGDVDPLLQRILVETITDSNGAYAGSAKQFHDSAKERESEAYKARIIA